MKGTDGKNEPAAESARVSQMVKCDVCGRNYNRRYLTSHKRLSHDSGIRVAASDEAKAVDMILALFLQISAQAKKGVLERLTALSR